MTYFRSVTIISLFLFSVTACKKDEPTKTETGPLYAKRGTSAGIYDHQGRFMILRGVNYNVLGDYWQGNPAVATTKTYSPEDIKMMASHGFNCIRLLFSWSKLEPQKGVYDEAYIQSLNAVIVEAAKYGMYVMLDMHQDAWGKYIATPADSPCTFPNKGWDGAPEWATITDGASTCSGTGARENAPAVYHAFQNFWDNTNGIQDACIASWQHLVSATCSNQNLLGYDLLNEPSLGYKSPVSAEITKLGNYYVKLIQAIRSTEGGGSNQHIIFVENAIEWQGNGYLGIPDIGFTNDSNLIASPHHYFESITNVGFTIEMGYNILKNASSEKFQAAMLIGEWGYFGDPASDVEKVKRFGVIEDANFGSSTWWQWCQAPGDPHGISWDGTSYSPTSLHLIELDQSGNFTGNTNTYYLKVLGRAHPLAIKGTPTALTSNSDNGQMHLEANTSTDGITELWIPNYFGKPKITGTNITASSVKEVDGGYIAWAMVKGTYTIDVSF